MFYNDIFYFDVRLNQWKCPQSRGSFPAPRAYAGMSASSNKIFMYGGYDGRQQFGGIYVYDVLDHRWDKVVALGEKPTARMNHSLTFVPPHHLIMFGGREHANRQNDVSLFDISTSTWKMLNSDSNSKAQNQHFSSSIKQATTLTKSSVTTTTTPVGRTAHSAVHYEVSSSSRSTRSRKKPTEERILIFGGYAGSLKWLNDLQLLTIPSEVLRPGPRVDDAAAQQETMATTRRKPTGEYRILPLIQVITRCGLRCLLHSSYVTKLF